MPADYLAIVNRAADVLSEGIFADFSGFLTAGDALWEMPVQQLMRQVGHEVAQRVVDRVAAEAVAIARERGLVIERTPEISFLSIFDVLRVKSPYLVHPEASETDRPVNRCLRVHGGGRTPLVERALTDFGIETSFERARERFREHYGLEAERTSILRVVERQGERAEQYVRERLVAAEVKAELEPPTEAVGVMVAELDGCEIRTGELVPKRSGEVTPVRELPSRRRITHWRDVRVGLVRPLDSDAASYVARLADYDDIVEDLAALGAERGAGADTTWAKVVDGGNGLREALDRRLSGPTILDLPHVRAHMFETAREMGMSEGAAAARVADWTDRLSAGDVPDVIEELDAWRPAKWTAEDEAALVEDGTGKAPPALQRVRRLSAHLLRFADAVGYDAFREAGLPVGNGEVESAHRFIPQARLKLPGAWWLPKNVNRMLALRVVRANGWWEDFWATSQRPLAAAA